jgi:tripartite-type tricarboxylate transporter receptor subunit TctC
MVLPLRILCSARRKAGVLIALVAMGLFAAMPALAQTPLRLVVPFPPGGGLDAAARLIALHLGEIRAETVVVENRPGADALIAVQYVANAQPDGRTLLMGASYLASNVVLHRFNFDPVTELTPVIMTSTNETVLAVNAALDVHSVQDLVNLARNRPGGLNCGAAAGHPALACEQIRAILHGAVTSIPFSGLGPATTALAAGHVDLMMPPRGAVTALADAGKVRYIAGVDDRKLAPPLDHLPILRDTWPAMYVVNFNGIFAPAGTPARLVQALNADLNRVLALPAVANQLTKMGYHLAGGPPETLGRAVADSVAHMRRIADQLGIKPN